MNPAAAEKNDTEENGPVRPIINPVTDKLGTLQRQIKP
jgi:hypothetical protein